MLKLIQFTSSHNETSLNGLDLSVLLIKQRMLMILKTIKDNKTVY